MNEKQQNVASVRRACLECSSEYRFLVWTDTNVQSLRSLLPFNRIQDRKKSGQIRGGCRSCVLTHDGVSALPEMRQGKAVAAAAATALGLGLVLIVGFDWDNGNNRRSVLVDLVSL